jgi:hypothetical protein
MRLKPPLSLLFLLSWSPLLLPLVFVLMLVLDVAIVVIVAAVAVESVPVVQGMLLLTC